MQLPYYTFRRDYGEKYINENALQYTIIQHIFTSLR